MHCYMRAIVCGSAVGNGLIWANTSESRRHGYMAGLQKRMASGRGEAMLQCHGQGESR